MNGESSITTSLEIGCGSRRTSNRSAPDAANTTTPRVPLASNSLVEVGADALEVALQLLALRVVEAVLAQRALDHVEQRLELDGAVARRRELARIEVQIEAQDLVALGPQAAPARGAAP